MKELTINQIIFGDTKDISIFIPFFICIAKLMLKLITIVYIVNLLTASTFVLVYVMFSSSIIGCIGNYL